MVRCTMKRYKCNGCKWVFIVAKPFVFGPIFEDNSAEAARIMPRQEFYDGYGDCWTAGWEVSER
jgi:rubredoxin